MKPINSCRLPLMTSGGQVEYGIVGQSVVVEGKPPSSGKTLMEGVPVKNTGHSVSVVSTPLVGKTVMNGDPVGCVLYGASEAGGAVPEKTLRDDQVLNTVMLTLLDSHAVMFDGGALVGKAEVRFPAEAVEAPDGEVAEVPLRLVEGEEVRLEDIALVAEEPEVAVWLAPVGISVVEEVVEELLQ